MNRIGEIITTEDGKKFMILHQAIYEGKNYYACCGVTSDDMDLSEEFYLFEETKEDDKVYINQVEDPGFADFILKHLNLLQK